MGAIGGLLGTAGGASGTGFSGPGKADIQSPVTQGQVQAGQAGATNSLDAQKALLQALQGQGGIGNQNQVYNQAQGLTQGINGLGGAQTMGQATDQQKALNQNLSGLGGTSAVGSALSGQGALAGQLQNANGIGAQVGAIQGLGSVLSQQQGTASQLQGIANGTGPNPAQAALNQATGQNVANQAALMAGQRGAGANVGLLARQAAQQGAGIQQQAVGQGATMQAQQQMNALGQLGGQEAAMGATNQNIAGIGSGLTAQQQAALAAQYGQGAGAIGLQQSGIGQEFQQGQGIVGAQQAQTGINAGIAQNQVGNLAGVTGANVQGNIGNSGQLMGAAGQFNNTQAGQQSSVNAANAGLTGKAMEGQQGLIGGVLNSAGAATKLGSSGVPAAAPAAAYGGQIEPKMFYDGGAAAAPDPAAFVAPPPAPMAPPAPSVAIPRPGPQSSFGQFLQGIDMNQGQVMGNRQLNRGAANLGGALIQRAMAPSKPDGDTAGPDMADVTTGSMAARGGMVHAVLSEKEAVVPPDVANSPKKSGEYVKKALATGGTVKAESPEQKAVKKGNSYANDKIPKDLPEGAIVIPRSVMQSKDPARGAADFVAKVLAKRSRAS